MIKKIDGKLYMHYGFVQVIVTISILILCFVFGSFLYKVWTNIEVFQKDPFNRGMEMHKFTSCQCVDIQDRIWTANGQNISTVLDLRPAGWNTTFKWEDVFINESG